MTRHFIVLALLCQLATTVLAADAPSYFRKSQGAVGDDFALPEQFGAKEQLVWRHEVSPGISTPCVYGDLVVLTTWDKKAKELATLALDRATGKLRWKTGLKPQRLEAPFVPGSVYTWLSRFLVTQEFLV